MWLTALFLAPAPRGKAQETQRLRDRLAELCRAARAEGTNWHLQRALFASEEARDGTPLKVLFAQLGHTSIQVTEMYVRSLLGVDSTVWSGAGRRLQAMVGTGAASAR